MIDAWIIARFEVFRALRTWRGVALVALYAVTTAGAAYVFAEVVGVAERQVASSLGVAPSEVPGAMMSDLVGSEGFLELLTAAVGTRELAEQLRQVPMAALFQLWLGFLLVPFFAASAAAESISIDTNSRAIRYEALRTGRMEIVFGRFAGQLLLTGAASGTSAVVMWGTVAAIMALEDELALFGWIAWYTLRTWFFAVPFVGIGVACSQWTDSAAWSRVLAIAATAGSWVMYFVIRWMEAEGYAPWLTDVALQVLPQGWIRSMWEPGLGWVLASAATTGLGVVALLFGYVRFARRDL